MQGIRMQGQRMRAGVLITLIGMMLVLSCLMMVAILSGWITIDAAADTLQKLLLFSAGLLLLMAVFISRRIIRLWQARRSGKAAPKLHLRLSMLFVFLTVVPALMVAAFSILFFHIALQGWFSNVVRTALFQSDAVAHAYLREHEQAVRSDTLSLLEKLDREGPMIYQEAELIQDWINRYAEAYSIQEIVLFEKSGYVLAKTGYGFELRFESPPPQSAFDQADSGKVAIITSPQKDRVKALVRLKRSIDSYLYVGRFVDYRVLDHMERVQAAVKSYQDLEGRRSNIEMGFAALFTLVTLLFVLVAIWSGLTLANSLVGPLSRVIDAADDMRAGKPHVRLEESGQDNEIGVLAHAFNRMAEQLSEKRKTLIKVNKELDLRIKFTETVLGGVSAGVIGLDGQGRIHLPNRASSELIGLDLSHHRGEKISQIMPEFNPLLKRIIEGRRESVEGEVVLRRRDTRREKRRLMVRISSESSRGKAIGYVVTFDDVTELIRAQKSSAWAEVARRIAHEIKNPLTPIQLAAERLRSKYAKQIGEGREAFLECTATIVRQAGDLGRMVDEFSDFSRLPPPQPEDVDSAALCRQVLALEKMAHADILFSLKENMKGRQKIHCDGALLSRALTNVIKNAIEAVREREKVERSFHGKGKITLAIQRDKQDIIIKVSDNGRGFEGDDPMRLSEPYVTTRKDGTGLGLAIVRKIIEDHRGSLLLENRRPGALVTITLPSSAMAKKKPSLAMTKKKPSLAMTKKKPSLAMTKKKPSLAMTKKKPSLAMTKKKPSLAMTKKKKEKEKVES